jgi:hypothetical protein
MLYIGLFQQKGYQSDADVPGSSSEPAVASIRDKKTGTMGCINPIELAQCLEESRGNLQGYEPWAKTVVHSLYVW